MESEVAPGKAWKNVESPINMTRLMYLAASFFSSSEPIPRTELENLTLPVPDGGATRGKRMPLATS